MDFKGEIVGQAGIWLLDGQHVVLELEVQGLSTDDDRLGCAGEAQNIDLLNPLSRVARAVSSIAVK